MEENNNDSYKDDTENVEPMINKVTPRNPHSESWLYLGILVLVSLIIITFIKYKLNGPEPVKNFETTTEIPTKTLLTTEQVDKERTALKVSSSTSDSKMIKNTHSSIQTINLQSAKVDELHSVEKISSEEAAKIVETNKPHSPVESVKIESNGTGIEVGEITVINTATEGKSLIQRKIQGVVFSIDYKNKYITVTNPDGAYQISVSSDTKFIINNLEFSFNDLQLSDIVTVEGDGVESVNELFAKTIEVTDTFEINTSIN